MVAVPQGVSNDNSKLGYSKDKSIFLQSLPSTSHLYGLETRFSQSGSLQTDSLQQKFKKLELLYTLPPFSMIGRVLLRVREEGLTMILATRNWPA